eukprot:jgi/Hompol1/1264/HPOL_002669-RA
MRFVRVDLSTRFGNYSLPPLDFRVQFLLLVDIIPFILAIILLAFFQPLYVIVWYVVILMSIGGVIAGSLLMGLPTASAWTSFPSIVPVLLVAIGASILFLTIVILLVLRFLKYRRRRGRKARIHPKKSDRTPSQELKFKKRMGLINSEDDDSDEDAEDEAGNGGGRSDALRKSTDKGSSSLHGDKDPLTGRRESKKQSVSKKYLPRSNDSDDEDEEEDNNDDAYGSEPNLASVRKKRDYPRLLSSAGADNSFSSAPVGIGIAMLVIGGIFLIYVIMLCVRKGRIMLHKAKAFSLWNMGTLVFLFLSAAYIPISTSLLSVFGCSWQTCSASTEFAVRSVSLDSSFSSDFSSLTFNGTACTACNFNTSICSIATSLCPGDRDLRLNSDSSFSCSSEILPFYGPGAALMFVAFCIGVPATKLVSSIPRDSDIAGSTNQTWFIQMQLSTNLCRGLYYGFKYNWRYYSLIFLYQKMAIVAIFVFTTYYPNGLLYAILAVHGLCFLIALIFRPYIRVFDLKKTKKENAGLRELIGEIDEQMNAYTVKMLVRFFMAIGIVAFLSLSLSAVGFIRSIASSNTFTTTIPYAHIG